MNPCIIVYIDILGFGNYVLKNSLEDCLTILQLFDTGSSSIRDVAFAMHTYSFEKNQIQSPSSKIPIEYKYFLLSDSVVIAIELNEQGSAEQFYMLIHMLIDFQVKMFEKNLPLRGGISVGEFYSQENILLGKGLVNAVSLEKSAISPRILIDKLLLNTFNVVDKKIIGTMLSEDNDGNVFIDLFKYFGRSKAFEDAGTPNIQWFKESSQSFFEIIQEYLNSNRDNKRLESKLSWVQKKMNEFNSFLVAVPLLFSFDVNYSVFL